MQKCITTVLVWLIDTLFSFAYACKLSRVACRGEQLWDVVLTRMPTVLSSTYIQRFEMSMRVSLMGIRKHSAHGPLLVP